MAIDLIIRGGSVVREGGMLAADIAIDGGAIVEIAPAISLAAREVVDAANLHVFPGLVDPHVHFNEPGRTEWEGVATGSAALAAGGGTCFFDMPLNSAPPVLDAQAFDRKRDALAAASLTDFAIWGGLTPNNLDHLEPLAARGVIGFKAFMCNSGMHDFPAVDDWSLYRGMKVAKSLGLPVAVHAESESITARLTAEARAAGKSSARDFEASRPIIAEIEAIARAITLAEETGCSLHVVHVSSARGTELVRRAAERGETQVTCETCPHYLVLNENDLQNVGAGAKCAPPLRSAAENDELWRDLAAGKLAFVASDHSPCPPAMKQSADFFDAWGGIAGVQSTLPILLSRRPRLPLEQIARLSATNAASRFGIVRKGRLQAGFDADLTLVDINACDELRREHLLDRHKQSPYVGRPFHGQVRRTILRGRSVFVDGEIVSPPIGQFLRKSR